MGTVCCVGEGQGGAKPVSADSFNCCVCVGKEGRNSPRPNFDVLDCDEKTSQLEEVAEVSDLQRPPGVLIKTAPKEQTTDDQSTKLADDDKEKVEKDIDSLAAQSVKDASAEQHRASIESTNVTSGDSRSKASTVTFAGGLRMSDSSVIGAGGSRSKVSMATAASCAVAEFGPLDGRASESPASLENGSNSGLVEGMPLVEHPLMVAWKLGRIIEAHRELKRLEETQVEEVRGFPASVIEQVRRIGGKFEESQSLLGVKISDLPIHEANSKMKLEWGLQINQGSVRAIYSVERDLDVCKGVAALQEKDLDQGLKENIVRIEKLGVHKPNDAVWRVITHTKAIGTKGDDIVVESTSDALDEPMGAIWMTAYSPPKQELPRGYGSDFSEATKSKSNDRASDASVDDSTGKSSKSSSKGRETGASACSDVHGVSTVKTVATTRSMGLVKTQQSIKNLVRKGTKFLTKKFARKRQRMMTGEFFNGIHLPSPEMGHSRSGNIFVATKVSPIHSAGEARLHGFRQTSVVEAKIPAAVQSVISVMPNFMIRKMARTFLEGSIAGFAKKVSLPAIEERLNDSDRAPFYQQLRCHLLGEPPAPIDWKDSIDSWISTRESPSCIRIISGSEIGPGKSVAKFPSFSERDSVSAASSSVVRFADTSENDGGSGKSNGKGLDASNAM